MLVRIWRLVLESRRRLDVLLSSKMEILVFELHEKEYLAVARDSARYALGT